MLRRAAVPALTVVLLALASGVSTASPRSASLFAAPILAPGALLNAPGPQAVDSNHAAAVVDMKPVRLVIPSIHLDAKIEARGLDAKRNLDTAADPNDAAWYDGGPMPGQPGNAIINGHVDWWTGNAVFTELGRLRPGDAVEVIRADGHAVLFRVTTLQRVRANDRVSSLFAPSSAARLTLITCTGVWNPVAGTDTQRLLVSAAIV